MVRTRAKARYRPALERIKRPQFINNLGEKHKRLITPTGKTLRYRQASVQLVTLVELAAVPLVKVAYYVVLARVIS